MESLHEILPLSDTQLWLHAIVFTINLLLLAAARPITRWIEDGVVNEARVRLYQSLNILFLIFHSIDLVLIFLKFDYQQVFTRIGSSIFIIYLGLLVFGALTAVSRRRFGTQRQVDNETLYFDSYASRLMEILALLLILLLVIYGQIVVWGLNSLLETTGIFGIIFGFAALTSNVWAPDLLSGMIILNAQILEDGDVVQVDGYKDEFIISKVSFIYTILYDIRNNHRTLMRNKRFIESKVDNVSKIASTDGIRKCLKYKLSYPDFSQYSEAERKEALARFKKRVEKMFTRAFERACEDEDIKINRNREFEFFLSEAGDFALEYSLFVYLARIPNTKVTATARSYLIGTLYQINQIVYESSILVGLELKTPNLLEILPLTDSSVQDANAIANPTTE